MVLCLPVLGKSWDALEQRKDLNENLCIRASCCKSPRKVTVQTWMFTPGWCIYPGGEINPSMGLQERTELCSVQLDTALTAWAMSKHRCCTCFRKFARCYLLAVTAHQQNLCTGWVPFCSCAVITADCHQVWSRTLPEQASLYRL